MALTHQVSPQLGQLPFLETRETVEESFASDEAQYGISQEFQQFVVAVARQMADRARRLDLACLRTVRQSLLNQFLTLEVVPQALFQRQDFA